MVTFITKNINSLSSITSIDSNKSLDPIEVLQNPSASPDEIQKSWESLFSSDKTCFIEEQILRLSFPSQITLSLAATTILMQWHIRENIDEFVLENVNFPSEAWEKLLSSLASTNRNYSLEFDGCDLSPEYLGLLSFTSLPGKLNSFSILNQEIDNDALGEIENILRNASELKFLGFKNNAFDGFQIASICEALTHSPLVSLNFCKNHFGSNQKVFEELAVLLKNKNISYLNLADTNLSKANLSLLVQVLQEKSLLLPQNLISLDLSYNRDIDDEAISQLLKTNILSHLTLKKTSTQAIDTLLKEALDSPKLKYLILGKMAITPKQAQNICSFTTERKSPLQIRLFPDDDAISDILDEAPSIFDFISDDLEESPTDSKAENIGVKNSNVIKFQMAFWNFFTPGRMEQWRKAGELAREIQHVPLSQNHLQQILQLEEAPKEYAFRSLLETHFTIKNIAPNGDCFFAAIAAALENYQASDLRFLVTEYIRDNGKTFIPYISEFSYLETPEERLEKYCNVMSIGYRAPTDSQPEQKGTWGGEIELNALISLFEVLKIERHICVFDIHHELFIEEGIPKTSLIYGDPQKEPIYLHRERQNHFNVMFLNKKRKDFEGSLKSPENTSQPPTKIQKQDANEIDEKT